MTCVVVYVTLDVVINFLEQCFEVTYMKATKNKTEHKLLIPAPLLLGTYPKEMSK